MSIDRRYPLLKHAHSTADVTSGVFATGRLGTGTASTSTFLRGDSTWANVLGATTGGVFPNYTMRLSGSTNAYIELSDNGTRSFLIGADSTGGLAGTYTNHQFALRTNNTDRIVIGADGAYAADIRGSIFLGRNIFNNARIDTIPAGAGAAAQGGLQWFSDNNLYIDAPMTGTPTGGAIIMRSVPSFSRSLVVGAQETRLRMYGSSSGTSAGSWYARQDGTDIGFVGAFNDTVAGGIAMFAAGWRFRVRDSAPHIVFDDIATSTSASAGAQTLPSNPVGFMRVLILGTEYKIPYYAV